jgi:hypothetical protein
VLEIIRINKYTYIACDILFVVFLVCTALNKMDLHLNLMKNESEYQEVKKNFFKFLRASKMFCTVGWQSNESFPLQPSILVFNDESKRMETNKSQWSPQWKSATSFFLDKFLCAE